MAKYAEVSRGKIKNVDRLETKKGVFITIDYDGDASGKYQAVSFVNNSAYVQEWTFGPQPAVKNDPITANNMIRLIYGDKLKDNVLYQMKQ